MNVRVHQMVRKRLRKYIFLNLFYCLQKSIQGGLPGAWGWQPAFIVDNPACANP